MVLAIMLVAENQNKNTPLIKQGEVDHSAGDRLTSKCATGEDRSNETKWIIGLYSVIKHLRVN